MSEKIRVLHFIPGYRYGGIETIFTAQCQYLDWSRFAFDLLTETMDELPAFETIRKLGGKVYRIPRPVKKAPWRYMANMKRFFAETGHCYPIVHSRVPSRSFPFLYYAKKYGVKKRVLHAHSTVPSDSFVLLYKYIILPLNNYYATHYAANSSVAAKAFFGNRPFYWMKNGLELNQFKAVTAEQINSVRQELQLKENFKIIGNAGRFCYPKNIERMLDVFRILSLRDDNVRLLLVGDGPDMNMLRQKTMQLNLNEKVIFTGRRSDVPVLMRLMDVLFMPSRYEGFGNVITEALASDLRCLVSDVIPYPHYEQRTFFRSLNDSDEKWTEDLVDLLQKPRYTDGVQFIKKMGFDAESSVSDLCNYYNSILES